MPNRPQDQPDWDNLIFSKPTEAVELIEERAVAKARQVLHQDYLLANNRERWERMFYGAYPFLATHREVVEAKMVEVAREMPSTTAVEAANAEIAKRADAHIKHRDRFSLIERERAAYSGGPGFSGAQPPTPMDEGGTLSDTIKSRRARRHDAHTRHLMFGNQN